MTTTATTRPTDTAWQPPPGTYRITRTFDFAAAHHLAVGVPGGHKCARQHGHTWTVEITVSSTKLVDPGWVADFADLKPLGRFISEELDHRDLNDVLPVPPTTELVAAFLASWCIENLEEAMDVRLESVVVSEGGANRTEFRPRRRRRP